jgi:cephalosporin hydroxylase
VSAPFLEAVIPEQVPSELRAFIEWLPPLGNVLEIGVRRGGTAACWHGFATGLIIGVDLPEGIDVPVGFNVKQHAALANLYPRFRSVLGNSHDPATRAEVEKVLGGEKVSLLFIDGDHSAAGVMADYELYKGLVEPGGVIAFHDIVDTEFTRQVRCRVCEAWARIPGEKTEFVVGGCEWGGIGAVRV